jgi:hypothetical protein
MLGCHSAAMKPMQETYISLQKVMFNINNRETQTEVSSNRDLQASA